MKRLNFFSETSEFLQICKDSGRGNSLNYETKVFLPRSRQSTRASEYQASSWTTNGLSSSSRRPEAVQFGSCASTFSSDRINLLQYFTHSLQLPFQSSLHLRRHTPSPFVFLSFNARTVEPHIFQHLRSSISRTRMRTQNEPNGSVSHF